MLRGCCIENDWASTDSYVSAVLACSNLSAFAPGKNDCGLVLFTYPKRIHFLVSHSSLCPPKSTFKVHSTNSCPGTACKGKPLSHKTDYKLQPKTQNGKDSSLQMLLSCFDLNVLYATKKKSTIPAAFATLLVRVLSLSKVFVLWGDEQKPGVGVPNF